MTKPVQIINDYWLKETLLNGNPNLEKFYKEDLIKMIKILKIKKKKNKEIIEKATWYLSLFISDENLSKYDILKILMHVKKILKEVEHE